MAPDAGPCEWGVGFDILNIGRCGPGDPPTSDLDLQEDGIYELDTSTGILLAPTEIEIGVQSAVVTQSDGTELFVLLVKEFDVRDDSVLRVSGDRALVIIATIEVDIYGEISVSADQHNSAGPGAAAECSMSEGQEGLQRGGGGGGMLEPGGNGGLVGLGDEALGGIALPNEGLVPLRGGCSGGGATVGALARGGAGGGAIQIVSADTLDSHFGGRIIAYGGGGQGGFNGGGGGGGGGGGAILLQALSIDFDSALLGVDGGGGGGGGGAGYGESGFGGGNDGGDGGNAGGGGGEGESTHGAGYPGGDGGTMGISSGGGGGASEVPVGITPGGAGGGGGGRGHVRVVGN